MHTDDNIGKLMEALFAAGDEIHPFIKFQIVQYASIYEAVISYLFRTHFKDDAEVLQLRTHKAYRPVDALGKTTSLKFGEEKLYTCVYTDALTRLASIPFKDKVDCAVRLGLVDSEYASDIKHTYELRNLTHIETEAEKLIDVQLEQARLGYLRMKPFLEKISKKMVQDA